MYDGKDPETPPHAEASARRRSWLWRVVLPVLGLAAVGGAVAFYPQLSSHVIRATSGAVPPANAPAPPPPPVTVSAPLQQEVTDWDEFTGQFAAIDHVEVRPRVSGYLTEIRFTDGQMVRKGDLLFVIDPRPFEAALAAARARQAQAAAQLDLANRQMERSAELRKKDFDTASNYDQRVAESRVAAAAVESAKAAIRVAELDLEFTRITAPVSGRIGARQVSIGNLIMGGQNTGSTTLMTTIVSLDPVYFNFDMSESDYMAYQRAVAQGQLKSARSQPLPVALRLVDEKGWPHEGRLNFVDNQVDRGTGTIRARAVFDNPDLMLTPGQFGRIRIPASAPYPGILVPEAAVVTDQSRKVVMVVKDDGTVMPKAITPGPVVGNLRVVQSGLEATDRVVIEGLMRARPGAKVTPQPGKIELAARPG